jgi:S-formylglutathione hydrolase FrmB
MAVEDKFKPVNRRPTTVTSPAVGLAALWALALLLAHLRAADLEQYVQESELLQEQLRPAASLWREWATKTGAVTVSRRLGRLLSLERSPRLWVGPGEAAAEPDDVPVEVVRDIPMEEPEEPPEEEARRALDAGGDDPRPDGDDSDLGTPDGADGGPSETKPLVSGPATTSSAQGTAAGWVQRPASRILVFGASSVAGYLGIEIERCLESFEGVTVDRVGKVATGLTVPANFDWQAKVNERMALFKPDFVISQLGGNDCQRLYSPQGQLLRIGTDPWIDEYGRRMGVIGRAIADGGARYLVLGMPKPLKRPLRRCYETVNKASRAGARNAGAAWLETWQMTEGPDGEVLEEVNGAKAWMEDGFHLDRAAARIVAAKVCDEVQRLALLTPKAPELGVLHTFALNSTARRKETTWYAAVPRKVPSGGLPVLLLLHGAGGSALEVTTAVQRDLLRLAERYGLMLVVPDGDPAGWWMDSPVRIDSQLETFVMNELLPELARRLPTNGRKGVVGLSMGGHGAAHLALRHPSQFVSVSAMSGMLDLEANGSKPGLKALLGPLGEQPERWRERSALRLLESKPEVARNLAWRLSCGQGDTAWPQSVAFHDALARAGISHVWEPGRGGHDWDYWRGQLSRHVAWHAAQLVVAPVQVAAP